MRSLMLCILLLATPAWALPTETVQSGSLVMTIGADFAPNVHLVLSTWTLNSHLHLSYSVWFPVEVGFWGQPSFTPYQPGQLLDISGTGRFLLSEPEHQLSSTWQILAEPFTPQVGLNTTPFVLDGTFLDATGPRFHYTGRGTASMVVGDLGAANAWFVTGARFTIAQPVPEPGTWLLLASGLILAWLCRPRQRFGKDSSPRW